MLTITRKLTFDAGHRIPDHNSHCRNLHGHRYVMEITLIGKVINIKGNTNNGMIMDFSDIKILAEQYLINLWEHAFLVYAEDKIVRNFLDTLPGHKTVVISRIPTVENLAQTAFNILKTIYRNKYNTNLNLQKIVLYETPNCYATVSTDSLLTCHGNTKK